MPIDVDPQTLVGVPNGRILAYRLVAENGTLTWRTLHSIARLECRCTVAWLSFWCCRSERMSKPQFLQDLERQGYVVVPNVVSQESCDTFKEEALKWLESFPYGFKRGDRTTWTDEHLPFGQK